MSNVKTILLAIAAVALSTLVVTPPAAGAVAVSAAFSGGAGTATVGGVVYARQNAPLTLTVNTADGTKCVSVTGAHAATQTSATARTTWTFPLSGLTGSGVQTVTAVARPDFNGNGACTGQGNSSVTASYTSDNTAPVVSGTRSPAPSGAGWNKGDTTVTWSATDTGGSGVVSGPTPATGTQTAETTAAGTVLTASATDAVGNTGNGSVTVKLDRTLPTVTWTRTPEANAYGWVNTNVTVVPSCSDALSGIASCSTQMAFTSEGYSTWGPAAVDNAGNLGWTPVTGIWIDKTAPTLTGTVLGSPNGNGWFRGDVTVRWQASDALSGLLGGTPADSTITGEGVGLTASANAADKAGNTANATSPAVRIDRTPPVTSLSGAPTGWTDDVVELQLSGSDNLSGKQNTFWSVDGSEMLPGTTVTLTADGVHTVRYYSTDMAGNVEETREVVVRIDKTTPWIGHTFLTPTGYHDGTWTNQAVSIGFTCDDGTGGSGIVSCVGDELVTTDGETQVTGTATDAAGNTATDTATVWIDTVLPTILGLADRAPNGNGWYDADVTVSFTCEDDRSGVATCTEPETFGEGAAQSVTGDVTDAAGNAGTTTVSGINVDTTDPELVGSFAPGWHRGDVTVDWTCTDALSGVDVDAEDDVVSGEGADLGSSASCSDRAGNTADESVTGIKIDRTAPHTDAALDGPQSNGWYTGAVEVTLSAADALSGVDATHYSVDGGDVQEYGGAFDVTGGGAHTVTFWSADVAGNVEDGTEEDNTVSFQIDGNPPVTTVIDPIAPGSGWFVECGIPVAFDVDDAESGVAATYFIVDDGETETYGQPFNRCLGDGTHTITYWSVDLAGNAEAPREHVVNVDTIAPTISGTAVPAANGHGWNNTDVQVKFDCEDQTPGSGVVAEDGLAGCGPDVTLTTEGADQSATGLAQDVAGNQAETTVTGIAIDKTDPTLAGAATTDANAAGWYRGDVEIAWTGHDVLSGIDPGTQPANSTVTGEGRGLGAGPVTISDKAGNQSDAASVSGVKIDRTPLDLSGAPTSTPNGAGWYSGAVTVDFTCVDPDLADGTAGSGTSSCPTSLTIDDDGAAQSRTSGPAYDLAGNRTEGVTVAGINIDGTAPTSEADNRCTSRNDWCTGDTATVVVTAADQAGLSGVREIRYQVDGGAWQTVAGDTANVVVPLTGTGAGTVSYYAVDRAGNEEGVRSLALRWDNLAPVVTHQLLTQQPNASGWNNEDVTVRFSASDEANGSGIEPGSLTGDVPVTTETSGLVVDGQASDLAGNVGRDSVSVQLDKTAPSITAEVVSGTLGGDGWYVGPVTVHFTCSDARSGIPAAACPSNHTFTANGADQSVTRSVTDAAGNTASTTLSGIDIDRELPSITGVNVLGQSYTLGQVPAATCTATDNYSGLQSCTVAVSGGTANGVGTFAYTATARDRAGNTATSTGTYTVRYRFDGFLQPINDTAHSVPGATPTTSIFKAGSTVPVKLQVKRADGTVVQPIGAPVWVTPVKGGAMSLPIDEATYAAAADSGASFRSDGSQWMYNWKTDSKGGNYWRIGARLDDGQTYYVYIGLR